MLHCLLLGLALSCVKNIQVRSPYKLQKIDDYLVSNIYNNPSLLRDSSKNLKYKIHYDIIVKNLRNTEREINLAKSSFQLLNETFPLNCVKRDSSLSTIPIASGAQVRIVCDAKLEIKKSDVDRNASIEIPLGQDSLKLSYLIHGGEVK